MKSFHKSKLTQDLVINVPKKKRFLTLSYALTPGIGSIIEERMTVTRLISNATRAFKITTNDSASGCS